MCLDFGIISIIWIASVKQGLETSLIIDELAFVIFPYSPYVPPPGFRNSNAPLVFYSGPSPIDTTTKIHMFNIWECSDDHLL